MVNGEMKPSIIWFCSWGFM